MKINTKLAIAFLFCFFLSASSYAMDENHRLGCLNEKKVLVDGFTFEVRSDKVVTFDWDGETTGTLGRGKIHGKGQLNLIGKKDKVIAVIYGKALRGNINATRYIEVFDTREVDFKAQKAKELEGAITSNLALRALAPLVKAKLNISFPIDPENGLIIQRDMAEKLLTEAGFDHNYVATLMSDDDMAIADLQREMEAKKQLEAQLAQAEIARGEAYERAEFAKHLALPKEVGQTVYRGDPYGFKGPGIAGQIEQIKNGRIQIRVRELSHSTITTPAGTEVTKSDLVFKEVLIWEKADDWMISSGDYRYDAIVKKDFESSYGGKLKPVK